MTNTILIAGATGDLGQRIVRELLQHDVRLRVLTRPGSATATALFGGDDRIDIVTAAYSDHSGLTAALSGVDVVVSAVPDPISATATLKSSWIRAYPRAPYAYPP